MSTNDSQAKLNNTLALCPFCGGEAEFQIFGNICNVVCAECHIGTRYESLDSAEQVVAAWNARAEQTCWIVEGDSGELEADVYALSCGHVAYTPEGMPPSYCPECGAKVVDE